MCGEITTSQEISMWCFWDCLGVGELSTQGCLPENKLSALRLQIDRDVSSEKFWYLKIRQDRWDLLFFQLMEMSVLLSVVTLFNLEVRNTQPWRLFLKIYSWVSVSCILTPFWWTEPLPTQVSKKASSVNFVCLRMWVWLGGLGFVKLLQIFEPQFYANR